MVADPMREIPEVRIAGSFNARDVGGHETVDGRTMATGVLYRSASLDSIDAAGRADLAELAVRLVIDLRSDLEIDRAGRFDAADSGIGWHHARSAFGPPATDPETMAEVLGLDDPMATIYLRMIDEGAPMFREALRVVASGDQLPAVVHCTSGKDRTGLLALVIQSLCGVPLETCLRDYERSADATAAVMGDMNERFPEMSVAGIEKLRRMAGTDPVWVHGVLEAIGGVDGLPAWLASIGVSAAQQQAIRGRFLS